MLKRLQSSQQVCRIVDSGSYDERFFIVMEVRRCRWWRRSSSSGSSASSSRTEWMQ